MDRRALMEQIADVGRQLTKLAENQMRAVDAADWNLDQRLQEKIARLMDLGEQLAKQMPRS